ncbi:GyrI-like domain-containing protein [Peribacillus tepidiphilus]|uniref:GyrI-like domain-containing protein n=1 Tax=Peribacillus tepidiphilus TaxID=2652445 RepID=UPI0035B532F9
MQYKIVERDCFQVVGIKREFSIDNEEYLVGIPKMWVEVNKDGTIDLLSKLNNGELEGVLGVCVANNDTKSKQQMDYWVATEYIGDTPDKLLKLEIPASKWAVFEVNGPMPDAMQRVWKNIFSEWFPSSGFQHAGTPDIEVYPDKDPYSPDYYSEIWIPVK